MCCAAGPHHKHLNHRILGQGCNGDEEEQIKLRVIMWEVSENIRISCRSLTWVTEWKGVVFTETGFTKEERASLGRR